jgi:hypothetical protein
MNGQLYNILAFLVLAAGCSPSPAHLNTIQKVDLLKTKGAVQSLCRTERLFTINRTV